MNEKFTPTTEQRIEAVFGAETLEEINKISRNLSESMRVHLANLASSDGSSEQLFKKAEDYLRLLREFTNYFYAQETSFNLNPENNEIVIEGAVAALAPKPSKEYDGGAKRLIDKLKTKYGI